MTDIDQAIETIRRWQENYPHHLGWCEGCLSLAALGRNCLLPLVEALAKIAPLTQAIPLSRQRAALALVAQQMEELKDGS